MVSGLHVLVLELVEEEHPDFTDEAVTEAVFHQLGECSAKWGESAVKLLRGESTYRPNQIFLEEKFHTFMCDVVTKNTIENRLWEMAALANQMECTVRAIGGQKLCDAFRDISTGFGSQLAEQIARMPITLDPGDISMHNVICEDKDHYCFLDFEYSRLCPMVFVMDVLGEPWESLPMDALADRALRAFLTGWNREADERIEWHDFAMSYHCVRVYRKCYEFEGWLSELAKNERDQQTREWAEQGAEQLMGLMHTAKQAIQA